MIDWLVAALAVVLVVVIVVVAMLIAGAAAGQTDAHRALGGAVEYKQGRRHNRLCTGGLVIDTLNFVFWRRSAGLSDRQGSPAADELVEHSGAGALAAGIHHTCVSEPGHGRDGTGPA